MKGTIGRDAHAYKRIYKDKPETFFQSVCIVIIAACMIGILYHMGALT